MIPWVLLDTAKVPNSPVELRLKRRGAEFSIMLGNNELMNSRLSGSEEALATLTAARLEARPAPNVLIGGLGMGFTLRAALQAYPADASISVAELVPEVVAWARGPMAEVFVGCLDDARVSVVEADVLRVIRTKKAHYDAILLDVDNGPEGLTHAANDRIYNLEGLNSCREALSKGGILAVWSSGPDKGFTNRLNRCGFRVEEVVVRAIRGKSGAKHNIWLASPGANR